MKTKTIFTTITITSTIAQVIPIYWAAALVSMWMFFIEGIFEGGLFSSAFYTSYPNIIFAIIFSFFSIIALINTILSFFHIKKINETLTTKEKLMIAISIATIIMSIGIIIYNKGILPRM